MHAHVSTQTHSKLHQYQQCAKDQRKARVTCAPVVSDLPSQVTHECMSSRRCQERPCKDVFASTWEKYIIYFFQFKSRIFEDPSSSCQYSLQHWKAKIPDRKCGRVGGEFEINLPDSHTWSCCYVVHQTNNFPVCSDLCVCVCVFLCVYMCEWVNGCT